MPQAYTPGLKATRRTTFRARRFLPVAGEVLVTPGQQVAATQTVARTMLAGTVTPVSAARLLSVTAQELPRCMHKAPGDPVAAGEILARSPGLFGWFPVECPSPAAGTVEAISAVTGQVLIRGAPQEVALRAYLAGIVIEVHENEGVVIESDVTLVQGIFGIGGEAYGPLCLACDARDQDLSSDRILPGMAGAIVVGGARVTADALARAVELRVAAIVTGGIDDRDLRDFLGYDLGVATTGSENAGLTLILTEGFGEIAMARATYELLASRAGADAAANGATQIRAGVLRPEVVIPWSATEPAAAAIVENTVAGLLRNGAAVRIIRDPYFGIIGTVAAMPPEPRVLGSGSKARVVEVVLENGERVEVPRANVELVEH